MRAELAHIQRRHNQQRQQKREEQQRRDKLEQANSRMSKLMRERAENSYLARRARERAIG